MKSNNHDSGSLIRIIILFTYLAILTALSLVPGSPYQDGIPGTDKILHFIFYLLLGFLLFRPLIFINLTDRLEKILILCIFLSTSYGILMEIAQGFVPYRSPELADVAANFLGSSTGSFFSFYSFRKTKR